MANTVIELRHSYVTGNVPSSLANGEIAINTYDGKLFYRGGASNTIQTIERYQGPSGLNGEIQFNDSGVLGANSGLTFDKITGALTVSGNVSTTQYFIGDGSKLTGLAPALQIYSLANTASGVSDYMVLKSLDAYTVGTQNTTTTTVTTTPTILTSFITDVGFPNITSIPSGDIVVEFDTQKASGVGGYYCYAEIYKRTVGGTETLIATTGNSSSSTLNTQIQQRVNVYVSTPISLNVSDRIVVKIYAVMLTTSASISIYFDGAADGAFTLPVLPASTLNFVPYINATANVQLNSYSLIANTVNANTVIANQYIQFSDGSRQYTANAGSGGTTDQYARNTANAAFDKANTAAIAANTPSHVANSASSYANSAFLRANNSLNVNTGGTVTGTITADSFITTGSYGNILGANTIYANNFIANTGFIQFSDGTRQYTANAGSGDQYARDTANAGFTKANTVANTAQAAFDKANTDVTNVNVTNGTYGNSTYTPIVTVAANGRVTNITTVETSGSSGGTTNFGDYFPQNTDWGYYDDVLYSAFGESLLIKYDCRIDPITPSGYTLTKDFGYIT